ncbi:MULTISPECIES: type II toxin-antitoxin system Phd/YefM family antitoxin [Halomonas]|uniref:Antitoxin n=2 Tax=Halomonas TaxID=2745 RepID=A0AAU7KD52_9GAMM|nr:MULTISPECIES: type II toxin-antitoxin system Phd/YefM family antitoxin [Halomonas]MBR9880974.1 type II toxin-antitoxin system Phd/YefM family antitoxin [Gammaproteobacteria bacterium]KJZ06392.1 antitoxin [Halomonas sp. S2151]MBY6111581.1 type II toxin-antitoxin system Phd/YefM family antitoxin [Halomonas sp. DP1Y21-3]MCJ8286929.1 type II toxin-antitoxin system Phd/YefM family antitoxin [Halomonas sp.]NQY71645.1 type II toxin-antitoxin system Phd/YefM family antitoxin [Halomonas sp.]
MTTVTVENARAELEALIDKALESHEPIFITGRRGDAVLLAEDDWRAILESLHLASLPAMGESIREGLETDLGQCERELKW